MTNKNLLIILGLFGWIEIIIGGLAAISSILIIITLFYCFLHPGQNWGLMIIEPLIWVAIPFTLLLIGGIGLLKRRPWGLKTNGFIFPALSLLSFIFIFIGKVIDNISPTFYNSNNFLGFLLFSAGSLLDFPYFFYFFIGWLVIIAAVHHFGYDAAKKRN